MSTRKLIKGDRYRAGLWKLEDSCYEGHVRMPNAKFMIRTYRCTQGEAVARVAECLQVIPRDLADLLKLAHSIWPDRIVVLPEAMDSAKSYDGNLAEEWDIVRGAATALYGLLFEDDDCEGRVADEFQRRTGYELTFSESSATRARADLMKMRERNYGGRTVDISAHIKGRSQKNTFRLHFYIDRENELIVIGHAGCHMKTAGSHRRGFK